MKETTKMINKFYKTQFDKKETKTSKGEIYKKSKQRKQTKRKTSKTKQTNKTKQTKKHEPCSGNIANVIKTLTSFCETERCVGGVVLRLAWSA